MDYGSALQNFNMNRVPHSLLWVALFFTLLDYPIASYGPPTNKQLHHSFRREIIRVALIDHIKIADTA